MRSCKFIITILVACALLVVACQKKETITHPSGSVEEATVSVSEQIPESMMTYCSGEVHVIANDGTRIAGEPGLELYPGSRIETGRDSTCSFTITNIGHFDVREGSVITLDSFFTDQQKAALTLATGTVLSKINKLAQRDDCIVRTRTLVCGVRGTEFTVTQEAAGNVRVSVESGKVGIFPTALLTSGLHPAAALVPDGGSLHAAISKDREQFDVLGDSIPVIERG